MTEPNTADPTTKQAVPVFKGKRLLVLTLVFIGLSSAGLFAVYTQLSDPSVEFEGEILSIPAVVMGLALLPVYFAADGLRLWFTLRALGHRVGLLDMARLVFLNIFVSNITPMATGGGFAQVWFLRRHGVPVGTAFTATTIRTVLAVLFIFGATPVLMFTLPGAEQAAEQNGFMVEALVICVTLYAGFFLVLLFKPHWLSLPLIRGLNGLRRAHLISASRHHRWLTRLVRETRRFTDGFRQYFRGSPVDILASWVMTAVFLLALFSFPAFICWALGYTLDYWLVVGRMVVITFVMYFSPTPGASGIAEGVFGHFFSGSLIASHLVLVIIIWRALTIYFGMAIGLIVTQHELARKTGDSQ